jgi:hypothetical protein
MGHKAEEGAAKRYRAVLLLVLELHLRGYQRLPALPGLSPSGGYWRCSIAPVRLVVSRAGTDRRRAS